MKNILFFLIGMIGFFSLQGQIHEDISVDEAMVLISDNINNQNFTILDVRTPEEYLPEHIEGAYNRNFYDTDFEEQIDSFHKERIYLIYCRSGNRSGQTFIKMKDLGFQNVYNMLGGILDWNEKDFPVTDELPLYTDLTSLASTTSILHQNGSNSINIYPNPFLQSINITSPIQQMKVIVTNSIGKVVLIDFPEKEVTLPSSIAPGVYYLQIIDLETNQSISTKKVIKK